jgi:hypothetical protein
LFVQVLGPRGEQLGTDVPALRTDLVAVVVEIPTHSAPIAQAIAERHASFERIHSFWTEIGRVGRTFGDGLLVHEAFSSLTAGSPAGGLSIRP